MFLQLDMNWEPLLRRLVDQITALMQTCPSRPNGAADTSQIFFDRIEVTQSAPTIRASSRLIGRFYDYDYGKTYGYRIGRTPIPGMELTFPMRVVTATRAELWNAGADAVSKPPILLEARVTAWMVTVFPREASSVRGLETDTDSGFGDAAPVMPTRPAPGAHLCLSLEIVGKESLPPELRQSFAQIERDFNQSSTSVTAIPTATLASFGGGAPLFVVNSAVSADYRGRPYYVAIRIQLEPSMAFASDLSSWLRFTDGAIHQDFGIESTWLRGVPSFLRVIMAEDLLLFSIRTSLVSQINARPDLVLDGDPNLRLLATGPIPVSAPSPVVLPWEDGGTRTVSAPEDWLHARPPAAGGFKRSAPRTTIVSMPEREIGDLGPPQREGVRFEANVPLRITAGGCFCAVTGQRGVAVDFSLSADIVLTDGRTFDLVANMDYDVDNDELACCALSLGYIAGVSAFTTITLIGSILGAPGGAALFGAFIGAAAFISVGVGVIVAGSTATIPSTVGKGTFGSFQCTRDSDTTFSCSSPLMLGPLALLARFETFRKIGNAVVLGERPSTNRSSGISLLTPRLVASADEQMRWDWVDLCSAVAEANPPWVASAVVDFRNTGGGTLELCDSPMIVGDIGDQYEVSSFVYDRTTQSGRFTVRARLNANEIDRPWTTRAYPARVLLSTNGGVRILKLALQPLTDALAASLRSGLKQRQEDICKGGKKPVPSKEPGFGGVSRDGVAMRTLPRTDVWTGGPGLALQLARIPARGK